MLQQATEMKVATTYEFWRMHPDELWLFIECKQSDQNDKWDALYRMLD